MLDAADLDLDRLPQHVGLIMDGNGRWANQRGLERTAGHAAGEEALFDTALGAADLGLRWLTAYTFSTENWNRSDEEVAFLMFFNKDILTRRRDELHQRNVRMHFIGDLEDLRIPDENRDSMRAATELTSDNTGLNLVFAFNYGGRVEIATAARRIARDVSSGRLEPDDVDVDVVAAKLYLPEMPDTDLVIRTSGEYRISNFLLWQSAYAEYVFPDILWPDFRRQDLVDCIVEFQGRRRRFGKA